MANIRCPMCSKINPPDSQVCGYCGARLKPVRPGAPGEPEQPASKAQGDQSGGEPDWLSQFRGDEPQPPAKGAPPEAPQGQAQEPSGQGGEEMPDWLSRIRDRARTETSSTPSELFKEEKEGDPDWLKGITGAPPADQGDSGDWLSRLQSDTGPATPPKEPPAESQGSVPLFADADEDWLRGLTDNTPGGTSDQPPFDFGALADETSGPQPTQPAGEDDWMSKLSAWQTDQPPAGHGPAAPTPPSGSGSSQSSTPLFAGEDEFDWLNNLGSAEETSQPEPPAGETSGFDMTSFLSDLETPPAAPQASKGPGEEPSQELSGFGLTGFLSGMELPGAEPQAPQPDSRGTGEGSTQEPGGFGLTGFLSGLDQPGTPQEPSSPVPGAESGSAGGALIFGEGGLEWNQPEEQAAGESAVNPNFADLFSDAPETEKPEAGEYNEAAFTGWNPETNAESTNLPDWLSGAEPAGATQAGPSAADSSMPDWLRAMESENTTGPAETPALSSVEDSSVPDWLGGISGAPAAVELPVSSQPEVGGDAGVPGWLSGMEAPAAPEQPETTGPAEEGNLPDWLASFEHPASEPAASEPAASTSPAETGLPAFSEESAVSAETAVSSETEAGAEQAEGLPDWFASVAPTNVEKTQPYRTGGLKGEPPEAAQPPAAPAASESAGAESAASAAAEEEGVPDWLREFHDQPSTSEADVLPLIAGEQAIQNPAAESGDQPFEMDLPDWLSEEASPAEVRDQQAAEPSSEQLAQAELPEWVKDMRPIESIIPGEAQMAEADQRVEKAGPLAGMRGVLPAEDLVTRYRKPPTYSVKLRVSEKQRGQASIFDSILQQESQPLLIPPERSFAPGALLRLLIAFLLIAAVGVPLFLRGSFAPLVSPNNLLFPPELQKMFDAIDQNTQSSSAPVLLAVDYEPGLSGEMRASSLAVINQLMAKDVPIVVISTVPTGPALAEQLLSEAQAGNTAYDLNRRVINLGYLPGGTMSLLEFAQHPRFAAPVTLAAAPAWDNSFISNITSLQGFSQVIVLTDRSETGRTWVEQVEPSMGSIPLYMVTSAQASPLLYPYYESGQIDGMVSGQVGGAMYAQRAGQENTPALKYLAAYQVGLALAFGLVLVGGIVSGSMALFKRGKKSEE